MVEKKILVGDDELISRQLVEAILYQEGYSVLMAENGRQVIEICSTTIPDLILLDVMMPLLNGFDTIKELKKSELTKNIPVILITALDDRDSRIKGLEAGAIDYISKPFNRIELAAKIKNNLSIGTRNTSQVNELENKDNKYNLLVQEILSDSGIHKIFPYPSEAFFFNTDEKKSFRKYIFKSENSDSICFYGCDCDDEETDFNLSIFALWLIKLAIHDTIYVKEASNYLTEKLKEFEKTTAKNIKLWFVFVTVNHDRTIHISGFNQAIFVVAENNVSAFDLYQETPGSISTQHIVPQDSCNFLCFLSKNVIDIYKRNKTLDYLEADFIKSNQNSLIQTLRAISEQTGVKSSFIVRLMK